MQNPVIPITVGFDPGRADAERRYDRVVRRLNRLSATRKRLRRAVGELERQFVDSDLVTRSGTRRGQSLTALGRRRRLNELLEQSHRLRASDEEYESLLQLLHAMNSALDAWVQKQYGGPTEDSPSTASQT